MRRFFVWIFLFVLVLSIGWCHLTENAFATKQIDETKEISGLVYKAPWNNSYQFVMLTNEGNFLLNVSNLNYETKQTLESGSYIKTTLSSIKVPDHSRNPGAFDKYRYLRSKQIEFTATIKDKNIISINNFPGNIVDVLNSGRYIGAKIRYFLSLNLSKYFDGDNLGLVLGIMTGDTSEMSADSKNSFTDSGLSHLMAVSGMHVSFILLPFSYIVRFKRIGIKGRNLLLLIPLAIFLLIADISASVVRAVILAIMIGFSKVFERPHDFVNTLFLAASFQLICNPFSIYNTGFILSYASALSIALISPSLRRKVLYNKVKEVKNVKRISIVDKSALITGLSVNLGLFPLMLYFFQKASISGIFITMFVAPLASLICISGYIIGLLGAIPVVSFVIRILSYGINFILSALLWITVRCASLPRFIGYIEVSKFSVVLIVVWYILLYLWLCDKNKSLIFRLFRSIRHRKILYSALASTLILCLVAFLYVYKTRPVVKMCVIDCGQGSCTLLDIDGYVGLIDTGDGQTDIVQTIRKMGYTTVDFIILTHGHSDHIGGFESICNSNKGKKLYISYNCEDGLLNACDVAQNNSWEIIKVTNNSEITLGCARLIFTVCDSYFNNSNESSENNSSLSVYVECEYGSTIISGDLQEEAELYLDTNNLLKDIDILLVPHHGSKYGSTENFISKLSPRYAIISVGIGNSYGHPSDEVIDRLISHNCEIYRTDLDGGISVEIGPKIFYRKDNIRIWASL